MTTSLPERITDVVVLRRADAQTSLVRGNYCSAREVRIARIMLRACDHALVVLERHKWDDVICLGCGHVAKSDDDWCPDIRALARMWLGERWDKT